MQRNMESLPSMALRYSSNNNSSKTQPVDLVRHHGMREKNDLRLPITRQKHGDSHALTSCFIRILKDVMAVVHT